MPMTPKHKHDCEYCRFLGTLNGEDLYFCPEDGALIRREGSEEPSYGAWPALGHAPGEGGFLPPKYRLVWELARSEGLI